MSEFWPIIDIEYVEEYDWVVVPPRAGPSAPFEEWDDIQSWGRDYAKDLWEDRGFDPGPNGVDFVAATLTRCAKSFCPAGSEHWLFLHLGHPTDLPIPVCVAIGPTQRPREETLRALTLADDPYAAEPPVVKTFKAERLGEGLTTFRYVPQDDSPHLLACVRYAWQVEEHGADVVMWTAVEDIPRLISASEDLENLAHSLAIWIP